MPKKVTKSSVPEKVTKSSVPEKVTKDKVLCYIVRDGRLLVFRHTDYSDEEVGIQVPAGSIRAGETPETEPTPERWASQEDHDGEQEPTHVECFWMPLPAAHILQSGQGALLGQLPD